MRKLFVIILSICFVFGLSSCGLNSDIEADIVSMDSISEAEASADRSALESANIPAHVSLKQSDSLRGKTIGCSICYTGDEWSETLVEAMEGLAEYYGADIVVSDSNLDDKIQIRDIENMIADKCDIIFVDPTSEDGETTALYDSAEAGIPYVIFDSPCAEPEKALANVAWDRYNKGVLAGDYFLNYLRDNGVGDTVRIIELANDASESCREVYSGFNDIIEEAENIDVEVVTYFDSMGNREEAYEFLEGFAADYDYVITDVHNEAMGAVSYLFSDGKYQKVFSMNGYGVEAFKTIKSNIPNFIGCVVVDPWEVAKTTFDSAIDYFDGKDVVNTLNVELYVADSSNIEFIYDFEE